MTRRPTKPASLSRRRFLRGLGAAVALPLLPSLLPRRALADTAPESPQRLLVYFVPNGIHMPEWTPAATGADWALSPIMAPLADFKSQLTVVSGLAQPSAVAATDGDHARGTGAFLTGMPVKRTDGADIENGISVNQVLANAVGDATRFRSLQLGIEGGSGIGACDAGYSCAYVRNISWAGAQQPLPKLINPEIVFDRLFGGADPNASARAQAKRKVERLSILDFVREDAHALQPTLSVTDRRKLDEYLTGVRELETRITTETVVTCDAGAKPPRLLPFPEHVRAMLDLMVLAVKCDLTRVVTFMQGNGLSLRTYPFLGISGAHHDLSHHQNDPATIADIVTINTWETEQLAYLLRELAAVPEGDGTLLDHSLVYFSSEIADGNRHQHDDLPIICAGSAGGAFATGQHVRYDGAPVAQLYKTLLDGFGAPVARFGADGDTSLGGLLTTM